MSPFKVLIVTSSGGGGLLQAAHAAAQEQIEKQPSSVIVKRDMMKDWAWKGMGKFGVRKWDEALMKGDVKRLEWLFKKQGYGDKLIWIRVFLFALVTIFRENVDRVVDTQPLGTSAILYALRLFNWISKKQVVLEKVIADLPTDRNTHFFHPIKKLSAENKKHLRLISILPLLEGNETREEFWQKHCGLSEEAIEYKHYPIRKAFLRLQGKARESGSFNLCVRIGNAEEKELLSKTCSRGSIQATIEDSKADFLILPEDKVVTILLGSKPTQNATLEYVQKWIALAQDFLCIQKPIHVFVCCANHLPGSSSLLSQVARLVQEASNYPSHLSIIPLSFQDDETIASMFFRSDVTCTRSGGQTAMELMCVCQGEIWVHSQSESYGHLESEMSLDELLLGIPGWEAGCALYLHRTRNAKIMTPGRMLEYGRRIFCHPSPVMN